MGAPGGAGQWREDGGRAALDRDDVDRCGACAPGQLGDGLGAAAGVVRVRGVGPDAGDADEALQVGAGAGELALDGGAQVGVDRGVDRGGVGGGGADGGVGERAVRPGHGLVGHAGRLYARWGAPPDITPFRSLRTPPSGCKGCEVGWK